MGCVISLHSTDTPPPQSSWSADTNRHIPEEIVEEILLNLPLKSLRRFSAASKSWNSIIHEGSFSKKYRGGKERIIIHSPSLDRILSCPISTVLSNSNKEATLNHVFPLNPSDVETLRIIDVCNGLWFVEIQKNNSMFAWNPTTETYRKLTWNIGSYCRHYGIGYDSVADDYKMLKICDDKVILYSLRSNSWRMLKRFPLIISQMGVSNPSCCVRGTLHWLYKTEPLSSNACFIVSFDLSTEEYGKLALPPEYPPPAYDFDSLEANVLSLRGKLCLSLDYKNERRFVLWVMEEYGVVESWTKKLDFYHGLDFGHGLDFDGEFIHHRIYFHHGLRPLYVCDNWENAIYVAWVRGKSCVMMNKDGKKLARKNLGRGNREIYGCGFVYVESLVSPAMHVAD